MGSKCELGGEAGGEPDLVSNDGGLALMTSSLMTSTDRTINWGPVCELIYMHHARTRLNESELCESSLDWQSITVPQVPAAVRRAAAAWQPAVVAGLQPRARSRGPARCGAGGGGRTAGCLPRTHLSRHFFCLHTLQQFGGIRGVRVSGTQADGGPSKAIPRADTPVHQRWSDLSSASFFSTLLCLP